MSAALAAAFMAVGVGAAQAGGTWLEPSDIRVEAGDELTFEATVGRGTLGWVDDGPYFLYLQGEEFGAVVAEGYGGATTDVPLGELVLEAAGTNLRVSADITIPEQTPPGAYWILACNDPCSKGLGELIGALIYVGMDPPPFEESVGTAAATPETTTAPGTRVATAPVTTAPSAETAAYKPSTHRMSLAPYPDRSADMSPIWVGISAALAGAVMVTALLSRQSD